MANPMALDRPKIHASELGNRCFTLRALLDVLRVRKSVFLVVRSANFRNKTNSTRTERDGAGRTLGGP